MQRINLTLPKFSVRFKYEDLQTALQLAGITQVFNTSCLPGGNQVILIVIAISKKIPADSI